MSEIANPALLTTRGTKLGLYVHVPFCASTCDFCAFYQTQPKKESIAAYLRSIEQEADLVNWDAAVSTLFWGGGTPGLLPPDAISHLGAEVRRRAGERFTEWTVELAPGSVTKERLTALKDVGVTRISLGVQTFKAELLQALGREHSPEQVLRAYALIRQADFKSVNLDLMFALPGQEEAAWLEDLHQAMELEPDHISTYCLTFEEDTALWVKLSEGKVKLDPEREARLYERTWSELEGRGFEQYEVSNFARSGHACMHNVNTWRMQEWVGLGPSAASQHEGWRGANIADLDQWGKGVESGHRLTEDRVALTEALLAEDALIFGLRMNEGVDLAELSRRFPRAPWQKVTEEAGRLVAEGLALRKSERLALTLRGRLVADAVGSELLGAFSQSLA